MSPYETMSREELLQALKGFAKNWLAHDGCWFLAAEERLGLDGSVVPRIHARECGPDA